MIDGVRFEKGKTYEQFLSDENPHASLYEHHYKKAVISKDDENMVGMFKNLRILILTESWCGDSIAILPVVKKLFEGNEHTSIRIFERDKNPDIMNRYLTNGTRSIPIVIFYNDSFREIGHWGPRAEPARAIFDAHREKLANGQIEKTHIHKLIRQFYAADRGRHITAEIIELLQKG
jgi:hypothetical protein